MIQEVYFLGFAFFHNMIKTKKCIGILKYSNVICPKTNQKPQGIGK